MMQISKIKKLPQSQPGLAIGPILFVIAILAVLVGALAANSGGFSTSTADESNRVNASAVIEQGISLKNGIDRLSVNGVALNAINLQPNYAAGTEDFALFASIGGGVMQFAPPANTTTTTGVSNWRFTEKANIPGLGNAGGNDFVAVIEIKNEAACKMVNAVLFGKDSSMAQTVPGNATAVTMNDVGSCSNVNVQTTTAGCNLAANAFDISAITAVANRTQACVTDGASTPRYFYFQVLAAG